MSTFHTEGDSLDVLASTVLSAGTLYQFGAQVGIANADSAAGEAGAIRITGTVLIPNPDGVDFADGVLVGYVATTDKCIATTTGDFDAGTAVGSYTGTEDVLVLLNGEV